MTNLILCVDLKACARFDFMHFLQLTMLFLQIYRSLIQITRSQYINAVRATKMSAEGHNQECDLESIRDAPVNK